MGPHRDSVGGNKYSYYSIAIVENWMRIAKLDNHNSKSNLIPDVIRMLYSATTNRIVPVNSRFIQELANFQMQLRKREMEKQNTEEWSRKTKIWFFETNNFRASQSLKAVVLASKLLQLKGIFTGNPTRGL